MIEFIRSLVRPIVTLVGWLYLLAMWYEGKDVPELMALTVIGYTGWFFYDRSQIRRKPKVGEEK